MSHDRSDNLLENLDRLLAAGASDAALLESLDAVLAHFDCAAGTVHALEGGLLVMRAQLGLPEALIERVRLIPIGKGMAGLAAERREPVQVCNLQTDKSGVAKASARETRMQGALCVPMLHEGELRGTIGITRPEEYAFSEAEIDLLMRAGAVIAGRLAQT